VARPGRDSSILSGFTDPYNCDIGLILYPIPKWQVLAGALAWSSSEASAPPSLSSRNRASLGHAESVGARCPDFLRDVQRLWRADHLGRRPSSASRKGRYSGRHLESNLGRLWWAHLRWLWQAGEPPVDRYCPDLSGLSYRAGDGSRRLSSRFPISGDCISAPPRFSGSARFAFASDFTRNASSTASVIPNPDIARAGLQPQRQMASADASLPGRELASQPSCAPRLGAARMELAATRRGLRANPRARETWTRN